MWQLSGKIKYVNVLSFFSPPSFPHSARVLAVLCHVTLHHGFLKRDIFLYGSRDMRRQFKSGSPGPLFFSVSLMVTLAEDGWLAGCVFSINA